MENTDRVQEYIELRKQGKEIEEKVAALETLILVENRDDSRIKIFAGRKTFTINEPTYDKLSAVGVEINVVETRHKKLDEFDIDVQQLILNNPENFTEKVTKESIRIK